MYCNGFWSVVFLYAAKELPEKNTVTYFCSWNAVISFLFNVHQQLLVGRTVH